VTTRNGHLNELVDLARAQGWRVHRRKRGHVVFYPADKTMQPVTVAGSWSDRRAAKNNRARLRNAGLTI
jgi:hypothetical protein